MYVYIYIYNSQTFLGAMESPMLRAMVEAASNNLKSSPTKKEEEGKVKAKEETPTVPQQISFVICLISM